MKVFISWSGETSHQVALALREWLPRVIQVLDPWVSTEDIWKGHHWSLALTEELATTRVAILCLTRENLTSPWLNFEAGALANLLQSRVIPFLFNMKSTELTGPLALLQYATFEPGNSGNRGEMLKTLQSLNDALPTPLSDAILGDAIDARWSRLEDRFNEIAQEQEERSGLPAPHPVPKTEDVLETILDLVRSQDREISLISRNIRMLSRERHRIPETRSSFEQWLLTDAERALRSGAVDHAWDTLSLNLGKLSNDLGRPPSAQELATYMGLPTGFITDLMKDVQENPQTTNEAQTDEDQ